MRKRCNISRISTNSSSTRDKNKWSFLNNTTEGRHLSNSNQDSVAWRPWPTFPINSLHSRPLTTRFTLQEWTPHNPTTQIPTPSPTPSWFRIHPHSDLCRTTTRATIALLYRRYTDLTTRSMQASLAAQRSPTARCTRVMPSLKTACYHFIPKMCAKFLHEGRQPTPQTLLWRSWRTWRLPSISRRWRRRWLKCKAWPSVKWTWCRSCFRKFHAAPKSSANKKR